jgi:hypothetical protein
VVIYPVLSESHRQRSQSAKGRVRIPIDRVGDQRHARQALQEPAEADGRLGARQRCAQAEVNAETEGQAPVVVMWS